MRRLPVDMIDLETAMDSDHEDMGEGAQWPHLDLETGDVVWVWEFDEAFAGVTNEKPGENARLREMVESQPERFVEVPDNSETNPNDWVHEFLDSGWTTDDALRRKAAAAYSGSIGRWKGALGADRGRVIDAWNQFWSEVSRRRALEFLAENGVEAEGTGGA